MMRHGPASLPERFVSPPSEAQSLLDAARESKANKLREHLSETLAAIEHLGEAQSSITYVDPKRAWVSPDEFADLWNLRGRLGKLRQHLRDELEMLGESADE